MENIIEYNNEKKTLIILDRPKTVDYNGDECLINHFECSDCKSDYYFEIISHKYCPKCGIEYKSIADVSI